MPWATRESSQRIMRTKSVGSTNCMILYSEIVPEIIDIKSLVNRFESISMSHMGLGKGNISSAKIKTKPRLNLTPKKFVNTLSNSYRLNSKMSALTKRVHLKMSWFLKFPCFPKWKVSVQKATNLHVQATEFPSLIHPSIHPPYKSTTQNTNQKEWQNIQQ